MVLVRRLLQRDNPARGAQVVNQMASRHRGDQIVRVMKPVPESFTANVLTDPSTPPRRPRAAWAPHRA
jgi:hypothetical protein